ncbi:MAG: F0F1 ATP synthase subunit alpha [Clostridia bacterium]|nr:F0F1 ATP synthase subunit alpha [Clostridia bacterium]
MEIVYAIINFLILIALIVLFGRKMILSIFRTRREKIEAELNEAEEIEKTSLPTFEEASVVVSESDLNLENAVREAQLEADHKIRKIQTFGARECHEVHREMIEKARKGLMGAMRVNVTEVFSKEPYLSSLRNEEDEIIDLILEQIQLTPGDMAYLKRHDVLYVTLTSAHKLSDEIVQKVDKATTKLLSTVNGKTSLWVREDETLIGGLRLRIGDTVYDGTVKEELYHFEKRLKKVPIEDTDAGTELLEEFSELASEFTPKIHKYQLGRVITISDGICWMDGLADIMYGEVVEFDCGERGMVLDIQQDRIGCVIFGEYEHIDSGSPVRRVGRIASVPVGEGLLGRIVDSVGNPIDGIGPIEFTERRPIECAAPAILDRAPVNSPLHTGVKAIDALVPIGKGQRELIIGDRQCGKSAIVIDTILNQKGKNTICIFVAIGQKETLISEVQETLEKYGAMEYTTIVAATASGSAASQYIAPFAGTAMAEYFMYSGKDVLIIYDDLSKHAVAYRELSLLLHRPSGREAYPGDIFYLHSRLLERSAHLSDELGGGSITAMPIIETQAGDISSYIPTNVISITDGQIFLDSELYNEGQRPAINVGLSVSRVGSAAQTKLMKQVSSNLRTKLAQFRELEDFTQFGTDVDEETKETLDYGKRLMEALKQNRYHPIEDWKQSLLLFAVAEGYSKGFELYEMEEFESGLYEYFEKNCADLVAELKTGKKMSPQLMENVKSALSEFAKRS